MYRPVIHRTVRQKLRLAVKVRVELVFVVTVRSIHRLLPLRDQKLCIVCMPLQHIGNPLLIYACGDSSRCHLLPDLGVRIPCSLFRLREQHIGLHLIKCYAYNRFLLCKFRHSLPLPNLCKSHLLLSIHLHSIILVRWYFFKYIFLRFRYNTQGFSNSFLAVHLCEPFLDLCHHLLVPCEFLFFLLNLCLRSLA